MKKHDCPIYLDDGHTFMLDIHCTLLSFGCDSPCLDYDDCSFSHIQVKTIISDVTETESNIELLMRDIKFASRHRCFVRTIQTFKDVDSPTPRSRVVELVRVLST